MFIKLTGMVCEVWVNMDSVAYIDMPVPMDDDAKAVIEWNAISDSLRVRETPDQIITAMGASHHEMLQCIKGP